MVWSKAGSVNTAVSGTVNILNVSSLPDSKFYMGLFHNSSHGQNASVRMGNSTVVTSGNLYRHTAERNGGSGNTPSSANNDGIRVNDNAGSSPWFSVMYIANFSGQDKLLIGNTVELMASGTATNRNMVYGKFAFTSNPIDIIQMNSANMPSGTNFSMLGSDGVESLNVQDGAVYYETDTNKSYVLSGTTWSEL